MNKSREMLNIINLEFKKIQNDIKSDYEKGKLTAYHLFQITTLIDRTVYEALIPGDIHNLLELRDAILFGCRLRLLLAEKLYNEPIADDWKDRLENCLNAELIC